jgi:hypothetical protein
MRRTDSGVCGDFSSDKSEAPDSLDEELDEWPVEMPHRSGCGCGVCRMLRAEGTPPLAGRPPPRVFRRPSGSRGQSTALRRIGASVPPGRPGPGVGVKKINVSPIQLPAKFKPAAGPLPTAILDSPARAESKIALGSSVAPRGTGYELAVTSCTLARARLPRGFRARGIFPKKSLS